MASTSTDRRYGISQNAAIKGPCYLATTANITLSGEQTIDGVTTSASRVVVKDQTDATENGIYLTNSSAWTRDADANGSFDLYGGTIVYVTSGDTNADTFWKISGAPTEKTIGTDSISWLSTAAVGDFDNTTQYELGTSAAAASHDSIITGHIIETQYHDSNRVSGSGGKFRFTGTTTAGKAGQWLGTATDGYGYDADGKQFANVSPQLTFEQWGLRTGAADNRNALRYALDYLSTIGGGGEISIYNPGTYTVATKVYDAEEMPQNITVRGIKGNHQGGRPGAVFSWTGTGPMFNFEEALGVNEKGDQDWINFNVNATNVAGGAFSFNDPDNNAATDTSSTPNFVRRIAFKGCSLSGAAGSVSGNGLQAVKAFEITTDAQCLFRNWKRGVWLKGCDNCHIDGRFNGNNRHIVTERSNTFSNSLLITARALYGCNGSGVETAYQLHLAGWSETVINPFLENTSAAKLFLNGRLQKIHDPWFGITGTAEIEIGANCVQADIFNPRTTDLTSGTVTVNAPASNNFTAQGVGAYGLGIHNPSYDFLRAVTGLEHPNIRVFDHHWSSQPQLIPASPDNLTINSRGVVNPRKVLTPWNRVDARKPIGVDEGISSAVDSSAPYGYALQIATTNNANAALGFVVGKDISEGDTILQRIWYRTVGTRTTGSFRRTLNRGPASVSNAAISDSATYTLFEFSYTLSGWSADEVLNIGVYNANSDIPANIALMECIVAKGGALTPAETTITNAGTASDYAIQAMTNSTPWGFANQAEGETLVEVVLNNQLRINELETILKKLGILT